MEQENRKYISIIYFLRKFIKVFFNLFFNIYILKIVNNDFLFIIKYTIFAVIAKTVFCYIILNFIDTKNAKKIYRSSFIFLISTIAILLILKEKIISYIYLFKLLEMLAETTYSLPYELVVIGSNNKKTMGNFVANINILTGVATIVTPIFAGFVIQEFSYYTLFLILAIETLIIIYTSFKIKNFTVSNKKLEMMKFIKIVKEKKYLKDINMCMFFRRISSQGAVIELLPVILFLRLGTEMDLGIYSSIFALISIISLELLKIVNRKKIKKEFYPFMAIVVFVASLMLVFNTSFITLIIYYILMNSFGSIIESESCSVLYASIRANGLVKYKKEHILLYNFHMTAGQLLSYGLVYVLYVYFYSVNVLSIALSCLLFFLILSAIYLRRTERALRKV